MTRFTAILPMRGGSVRVPGKNLRPLAGRPLYAWVLDALFAAPSVGEVVVDSDSPEILARVRETHPKARTLPRPAHLGTGTTPMNLVIDNVLGQVEGEWFLQTHSTNPFLRSETIEAACKRLLAATDSDSLFTVTPLRKRFWDEKGRPMNHDPAVLIPTQDLAPVYEENSCLYLFRRDAFLERGLRIGRSPILFEMDSLEAVDIDTESDWRLAEALMTARRGGAS